MFVIHHFIDSCLAMHLLKTGFQARANSKKKKKIFYVFLRRKTFVEKQLKTIVREVGPSSPCEVETFGMFCIKLPTSHFLSQGSFRVQGEWPRKGWFVVPLGKWGDSVPYPAGGWDMGVRPCVCGGTQTHARHLHSWLASKGQLQPAQGRLGCTTCLTLWTVPRVP